MNELFNYKLPRGYQTKKEVKMKLPKNDMEADEVARLKKENERLKEKIRELEYKISSLEYEVSSLEFDSWMND